MKLEFPELIQTDRLRLRRLRYEDAEEIFYCYASKSIATKYVSWPTHQSITDTRDFLQYAVTAWDQGTEYSFSIRLKSNSRLVGSIGLINEAGKVQIGYILSPNFWGQGIATEACVAIVTIVKNIKSVFRIGSFVDAEHLQSASVLKKAGFVEEARLKEWFRFINQGNAPKDCILFRYPLAESE
jgi:ribosomal-protein-alanine N-acetyltransferase